MMQTNQIHLGPVKIGGGAPISIQTMTNTRASDVAGTLAQIQRAANVGCDIIRCAIPTAADLPYFGDICKHSPLPVVADIHFDHRLAMEAIRLGASGIRVNPGNLSNLDAVRQVARAARDADCCVRVGVNAGSLSKDAEKQYGRTAEALVKSALYFTEIFQEEGATQLKVSLKSSDVRKTLAACRQFAAVSPIPLHIGITESGPVSTGIIKSAVGIGSLLLDGIGSTIRVSLTADPVQEVIAAKKILVACGLKEDYPQIISCPTCARTRIPLMDIVSEVETKIAELKAAGKQFSVKKIAVMGCEVNGPGEAKDADIGIAGGKEFGILFKHGEKIRTIPIENLVQELLGEICKF